MMIYWLWLLKKELKPAQARLIFNCSNMSKNKKRKALAKSGISIQKAATIVAPFYYEFGRIDLQGEIFINAGCVFQDNEEITIQSGTLIGPNVTLTTNSHPSDPNLRLLPGTDVRGRIHIGKNVWLGAGVVVLPGVNIGDNSVVAANSVVNCDIPENTLFAGCPAVLKKSFTIN